MISGGAFMVREGAAAVLFAMALGKLVAPRAAIMQAWRPKWMAASLAVIVILLLAFTEMALAVVALIAPMNRWILDLLIVGFFGLVTIYGLHAIARTGACGCGGVAAARAKRSVLLRRNALMLASLMFGVSAGPAFHALQAHGGRYAVFGSLVPAGGFAILTMVRIVQIKARARASALTDEGIRPGRRAAAHKNVHEQALHTAP
jgi:hypothetical protein